MHEDLDLEEKLDHLHHERSDTFLSVMKHISDPLIRNTFEDIKVEGLEDVLDCERQQVFISDHESEMDWLLLQRILSDKGIKTTVQAGDNLFVPGIGYLLRKCGGFMSVRDSHDFRYHGKNHRITKKEYAFSLYRPQLERILSDEGYDILIFPGYSVDKYTGETKSGRSYDGKFNPFMPVPFARVSEVAKKQDLDLAFREVKISYERVPEDTAFRQFKNMTGGSKLLKNVYDHANTFLLSPWKRRMKSIKPHAIIKFGEEHSPEKKGRILAEELYEGVGSLLRVYPTQLIFASTDDKYKISKHDLLDNVRRNVDKLYEKGIDITPVHDGNRLMPLDSMLNRIERLFNYNKVPIIATHNYQTIEHDKNEVFIWHPHLARYYSNKLNYLLKDET
ncbi:MAG: 1-acyl-sn-glycerol-3-phosphate acyltransferase [Candidatus Woesearchaeota archaeon]